MIRVESKNIFKIIGVVLLSLICYLSMTTSATAFNAQEEAKAISSNPENIYTVYIGMPRYDVEANFKNIKGWKVEHATHHYAISREYSKWASVKAGAQLNQRVVIVFDGTEHVLSTFAFFNTDSMSMALDLYNVMYNNLVSRYGAPNKTSEGGYVKASSKWISNGHTYDLNTIQRGKSITTGLMVRPVQQYDY